MKDRGNHIVGHLWSTVKKYNKISEFDVHALFDCNFRSACFCRQCSLILSYVRERRCSHLEKVIILRLKVKE